MLAIVIFVITLILVIWQPRGLGIGWSSMGGALVALATGVIHWSDIPIVWHIVWDATFTFVALIIISLILDEAGFFHWAALHVARWGRGSGRLLFPLIVMLGASIAAVFANDGAALLLTPIVMAILLRLDFTPAATFAFVIATGFVADTTRYRLEGCYATPKLGLNGCPDLSTPKARWRSLRMAAITTCMGRLPLANSRSQKAAITGLCRLATTAGR